MPPFYPQRRSSGCAREDDAQRAWSAGAGEGADDDAAILGGPIVADGLVFTMEADADVAAFRAGDGGSVWRTEIEPEEESDGNWGGGLAYAHGRIYAATGFAQVVALDARSGEEVWRTPVSGPMRAAPTVYGGRLSVQTLAHQHLPPDSPSGTVRRPPTGNTGTARPP